MKLTIIPDDRYIAVDGIGKTLEFTLDANIHAVQWDGESGTVEQKIGGSRAIEDLLEFQDIIDLFYAPPPQPPAPTFEELKAQKLAALAAYRYGIETGGCPWNGQIIATDDRAKTLLAGARTAADEALSNGTPYHINWKSTNGWVVLGAADIVAMSDAVRTFVQSCFDIERMHDLQISALTTTAELAAYDFTSGWPN